MLTTFQHTFVHQCKHCSVTLINYVHVSLRV